ncbi:GAF domain-containing protein [Bradyrhizobium sp. U87765 SZCCT0131]|nr:MULTISPECIES: HWE histidine kinase domain-containing protein [unclassified Bradyrhizobium]MBR1217958.1 GAF domain-containing protein [Bradyrhizobium sp. U87765 SZCCT0131]MBR1261096.1 GAF domain-containing protein [Bradyrhizobium sp. U87765 SZCCT0134]MBR1303456.1 GAF domain-containing protein [Bradyrhizobium sp. U87765 SZCCT0110]MBR1319062.1 GAF domain-containing protein [Bradyrhizobium sp. U87765 SZCCT0109]MBR1347387.1 GAF domain-containing protein [Bradyrhizobium sp. U87765 SZCCT0048]
MSEGAATVDLTNCDREPIHLLGRVQSYGFIVVVSLATWRVERVSANVVDWLGVEPGAMIGQPLDAFFLEEALHTIRGNLQSAVMGDTTARIFGVRLTAGGLVCDVAVHALGDRVVVECERNVDDAALNASAIVQGMVARLRQADTERTFFRSAAREMRALTGFDRVMIYRFDDDGSGEVIAESAQNDVGSYLGQHYPASDIPQQARRLYERNWLRIIPDIDAETFAVEPGLDEHGRPLDMSMSTLRSVSSIHLEYLRNMGVRASMSVSVLRQNKLWGLIACHHYAPHYVGFGRRTAAELFGQMFSLLMENRERETEVAVEARGQLLHQRLVTVMASENMRFDSIIGHLDDIADLLVCDGIGVWVNGRGVLRGLAPTEAQFAGLIEHLCRHEVTEILARQEIAASYPAGRDFADRAAGMLVMPLSRPARDFILFFRQEAARNVNWAGNPAKSVTIGPHGERLTPRKSFELWKETVRGQSVPWKPVERRIAENLRFSLLEVILRLTDQTLAERRRAEQRQELLVAELNHRVRNILALIRGVISQSRDSSQTVEAFTAVVGGRIQALARAHDQITAEQWGPALFSALVNAEAGAYLGAKGERVLISGPDAQIAPEAFTTVALVMHEMITNSAKYGALSDSRGVVAIDTGFDPVGRFTINWREQGGPPVKPPLRRGFGSTVIERSIAHDLKGEARIDFALDGLRAAFVVPASHVRQASDIGPPSRAAELRLARASSLLPDDILVLEDNMIIALDVEEMVRKLGVSSIRVASSVDRALQLIGEKTPDFALLDVNLGSETSFEVAERLVDLGVPFAFASGYGEQIAFPPRLSNVPRMRKPYSTDALRETIEGASSTAT